MKNNKKLILKQKMNDYYINNMLVDYDIFNRFLIDFKNIKL